MAKLTASSLSKAANDRLPSDYIESTQRHIGTHELLAPLLPPDVNKESVKMMQAHGQYDSRATYM